MKLIFLIWLGLILNVNAQTCSCDSETQHRRLSVLKSPKIKFYHQSLATTKGEEYSRDSTGSAVLHEFLVGTEGPCNADQIHISLGGPDNSLMVSFATYSFPSPSFLEYSKNENDLLSSNGKAIVAPGTYQTYSSLNSNSYGFGYLSDPPMGGPYFPPSHILDLQNTYTWAYDKQTGEHWANWMNFSTVQSADVDFYNNPYMYYDSPLLHTVYLSDLTPGATYYYRVYGSCDIFSFTMPPASVPQATYPFTIGLTGDLGQTNVSRASAAALMAMKPSFVLLCGDLPYADGWGSLWDSFGRMFQSLAAYIPVLTTGGNHEVGQGENWQPYKARFPTPQTGSSSPNFCFWAKEIGPVHVITLCTYAGYSNTSLQYQWLQNHIATKIDRVKTPWVIAMMHSGFYNSNNGHWMEGELMRLSMEPLLYSAGVDLILAGHVHSYERTYPVYNNQLDPCGPSYVNIGDGGNYEGAYTKWRMPASDWSAFRESSYGVSSVVLHNDSHLLYSWHRHACFEKSENYFPIYGMNFSDHCTTEGDISAQAMLTVDEAWITRPPASQCPNKHYSSATLTDDAPIITSSSSSHKTSPMSSAESAFLALTIIFGITSLILAYLLFQERRRTKSPLATSDVYYKA